MPTQYKDFAPTCFDHKGAFLPDRQEWYVCPVSITRDSDVLAESNFETAQKILDEDKAEYEVHRFEHWGPGWFEILLVHPENLPTVEKIEETLENYPVLDDDDYCEREYEAVIEAWESYGFDEFIATIKKHFDLSDKAADILLDGDHDRAWHSHMDNANIAYECLNDGVYFYFDWLKEVSRDEVAATIRNIRRPK